MDTPQLCILHNIIVSPKQMYSMDNVIVFTKTKTKTRYIYKRPLLYIDLVRIRKSHKTESTQN